MTVKQEQNEFSFNQLQAIQRVMAASRRQPFVDPFGKEECKGQNAPFPITFGMAHLTAEQECTVQNLYCCVDQGTLEVDLGASTKYIQAGRVIKLSK